MTDHIAQKYAEEIAKKLWPLELSDAKLREYVIDKILPLLTAACNEAREDELERILVFYPCKKPMTFDDLSDRLAALKEGK